MDADKIRLAETGLEELIRWMQNTEQPQTLEALTYQYIAILREMVLGESQEEEA